MTGRLNHSSCMYRAQCSCQSKLICANTELIAYDDKSKVCIFRFDEDLHTINYADMAIVLRSSQNISC